MFARLMLIASLVGPLSACTATKVTGQVEGEPVCADFALPGGNSMKGSLKQPIKITILEEGDDDALWERLVFGRRKATDKPTIFSVADQDGTYDVRWSQCPNQFAPKPVDDGSRTTDRAGTYECGEVVKYAETKLTVKGGDAASRKLPWQAPPEASCWGADSPAPAGSAKPEPSAKPSAAPSTPEPEPAPSASASASAATSSQPAEPTPAPASPPSASAAPN